MPILKPLAVLLLLSASAMAQITAVDVSNLGDSVLVIRDGKIYELSFTSGGASVAPLQILTPGKPAPPQPDTLTARGREVKQAAEVVTGDPKREDTAAWLSAAYRTVANEIAAGQISGLANMTKATKKAADMATAQTNATRQWQPVREIINNHWIDVTQAGGSETEYARLLVESSDGLDASVKSLSISREQIEAFIRLILLLLEAFRVQELEAAP